MKYLVLLIILLQVGCASNYDRNAFYNPNQTPEQNYQSRSGEVSVDELDSPIKLIKSKAPEYPEKLLNRGIEGYARIVAFVSESGKVIHVRVVEATHEEFGQAAIEAIEKWVYAPAKKQGEPTGFNFRIEVPFKIRPEATRIGKFYKLERN